jgi:hypothetical protein
MAVCHVGERGTCHLSRGIGYGHVLPLTWDDLSVRP